MHTPIAVLFVCHANLCRSPLAEGIFVHQAKLRGIEARCRADSAGCWAQDGLSPHIESVRVAGRHGIDLMATVGKSRGLVPEDLHRFDHVLAMDRANLADLERLRRLSVFGPVEPAELARIRLIRQVVHGQTEGRDADVPDPVGRGPEAYEHVFTLLDQACAALLDELAH